MSPNKTINDCLKNKGFDFSIAINTTAYYEILMNGIPCLRFHDETFVLMTGLYDFFTNESQFESQISLLQTIPEHQYQDNVNQLLEYAIGLGIDNYMDMIK